MPCFNTPRFSASQIIAAPIRHFTEYAGFLPSIFASTVALAPSVMRLSLMRGVLPILNELSAYTFAMMFPQWSEFAVSGSPNSIVRRGGKSEAFGVRRLAAALRSKTRERPHKTAQAAGRPIWIASWFAGGKTPASEGGRYTD